MRYSAADLVKRSCAQLVYFKNYKEDVLSQRALNGEEYQSKIVKDESLANTVADEMRGCYSYDDVEIFFCIDMIKNGEFYEIKSIQDDNGNETLEYSEWYLNSSLLQCAFYKSLLMEMNGNKLYTPKFRLKEGYKMSCVEINNNANYYLKFGGVGVWRIDVVNPTDIIDFYKNKIAHITDYDDARAFDREFKWKEFEVLKKYFTFSKIE
jgi:hypothetical protein